MRDIAATLTRWLDNGDDVALATVVEVSGSAPRPLGTTMAVSADGRIAGNVSAGCVEGAVVEAALTVLGGAEAHIVRFGISDEQAMGVGLTCGGAIGVLVTRLTDTDAAAVRATLAALSIDEPVALGFVTSGSPRLGTLVAVGGSRVGGLEDAELDRAVAADARTLLSAGRTEVVHYAGEPGESPQLSMLVSSLAPPPRLLIFGAPDFAVPLADLGAFLGYRVTVCDARQMFATRERFPAVEDLVVEWPHRFLERTRVEASTVICVLTHDVKFDIPVLQSALRTPARYIGLLGSRRSQEKRRRLLSEAGVSAVDIARLRAPIGLDLGARTSAETALSIAAEIVATQRGGTGRPLAELTGAIHHEVAV